MSSDYFLTITRCVCTNATFSDLKRTADEHDAQTIDELREHVEFASECELCRKYVERMLETGETEFDALEGLKG